MTTLVNRAKMTTATTGTGTITLGSAVDGYQTFSAAGVSNSDVVRYTIEDGDAWEIGLGTYSLGTLTRGSIESSNSDNPLNLSGEATVFVTAAAADLQELVDFADNFVLPTSDGSTGQVLSTNGAGTLSFTTITGYTDADVDTHLNTGTATTGEVLSWTGSDYDWVTVAAGATDIDGLSDGYSDGFSVGLGVDALENNDGTSNYNTALGNAASRNVTSGTNNIGIGWEGLRGNSSSKLTGSGNIGLGYQTGFDLSTGANNFLGGTQAGTNLTTGSDNVAIGNGALDAATTGGRNIAIGEAAMGLGVATNATGDNIAIGYRAGYDLTSGVDNVLIGEAAGSNYATASNNISIGGSSCLNWTGGNSNTVIGHQAGFLGSNSTGERNTLLGAAAGLDLANGSDNVFLGHASGVNVTSGSQNIHIGRLAGDTTTTGSNQVVIGHEAEASSATVSNEITLGNSSISTLRCQVTTITSLSDARDKADIQPLNAGLEFVEALNPVSFTWNMRDGGKVGEADTGFIAQDLQIAQADTGVTIPGLVFDANPEKLEAGYGKLIPVLVQAIKDLSAEVKDLKAQLEAK